MSLEADLMDARSQGCKEGLIEGIIDGMREFNCTEGAIISELMKTLKISEEKAKTCYDEAKGRKVGREEGFWRGARYMLLYLYTEGTITEAQTCEILGLTREELKASCKKYLLTKDS